jgi:thioredoxin reductase
MQDFDIAVIGAGAAGLSTAAVAAGQGASVAVFDDNALPGGQYFRQLPTSFIRTCKIAFDKDVDRGRLLYQAVTHRNVTYYPSATVWNVLEGNVLAFSGAARSDHVRARLIVVAAGAHDRPVPFPGWTLPGVVTAGGLQNLIKGQRVIPGRRAVVAGNGPLVILVGANLVRAGARLLATAEAAPVARRAMRDAIGLAAAPGIVRQAADYASTVFRSGAQRLSGWTVIEARGAGECEEVVLAPIDAAGQIDRAAARNFAADLLVTGFGLVPSIEILRICAVDLGWSRLRGGWLPRRSEDFETTRPGIFAVGDGSAIGGVEIALVEGRLMGLIAAQRLGLIGPDERRRLAAGDVARLKRLSRFRAALERIYEPPRNFLHLITPETMVCRCEEVTSARLQERRDAGLVGINALKSATRAGMGRCQGRNCLSTLIDLESEATGAPRELVPLSGARPPARPVLLQDLLATPMPPLEPPDPALAHLPRGQRVD